jgi:hypothetical protein
MASAEGPLTAYDWTRVTDLPRGAWDTTRGLNARRGHSIELQQTHYLDIASLSFYWTYIAGSSYLV